MEIHLHGEKWNFAEIVLLPSKTKIKLIFFSKQSSKPQLIVKKSDILVNGIVLKPQ